MHYLFLVLAICLECAGTYCLKLSDGFNQILPSIVCLALYAACYVCFAKALQGIPLSVAYATWCALGIVIAGCLSAFAFHEPQSAVTIFGLVVCVAGVLMVNLGATS